MTLIDKLEPVHIFVKGIVIVFLHDFSGCCSTNLLHQLWSPGPLPATQGSTFGRQSLIACHVFVDCKSCTSGVHVLCFFSVNVTLPHYLFYQLKSSLFWKTSLWSRYTTFPIAFPNFPASAPHQWQHLHSACGRYRGRWVGKTHLSFQCFFSSKL